MNTTQNHRRWLAAGAIALLMIGFSAFPASARQDRGNAEQSTRAVTPHEGRCGLARVGTQYVRCDNLTGNGVAAPGWVPER